MNNNPKVSIIIPVYNGEKYLKESIDSALNQTYKNIEIIVINDGSKDSTESIVLSYGNKIRYYKKDNGGVASALNLALSKMKGDYFSWLSHDDLYEKDKIAIQINELSKYDDKVILLSDYKIINDSGLEKRKMIAPHNELIKNHEKALLKGLINGITLLIPKKAFIECGNFNEELKCTQDYDLWFRMLLKGYQFKHINKVLASSRIHDEQTTNTSSVVIKEGNKLWENIVINYPLDKKIKMSGSEYNFYEEMTIFLNTQPYRKARNFCLKKCYQIDRKKAIKLDEIIKKEEVKKSYNPLYLIPKLIKTIKTKGLKHTITVLKRFIGN